MVMTSNRRTPIVVAKKPKATEPAAGRKAKDKTVTEVSSDPLADLGLDLAPTTAVEVPAVTQTVTTVEATVSTTEGTADVTKEEVDVGEIEFGFVEYIPTAKRKAEGSKYKFDQLDAPGVFEDGPHKGKPKIANFVVRLQPGVEADKLKRSVQSATTQANKQGKEAGKYFVSRSVADPKTGKFAGMMVLRTDDPPTKE